MQLGALSLARLLHQRARAQMVFAMVSGLVSGLGTALLLAWINRMILSPVRASVPLLLGFLGLCVAVLGARVLATRLVVRLGHTMAFCLRTELSERLLSAPMMRLEALGKAPLLTLLTEDIGTITAACEAWPVVCIHAAIVLGGMLYLAWLSAPLFALCCVVIVLGVAIYRALSRRAFADLARCRRQHEGLLEHFRTLLYGAKELRLSARRRHDFLREQLIPTAEACRESDLAAMDRYIIAGSAASLFHYLLLGAPLLGLALTVHATAYTLTGYALVMLYLMSPLGVVVDALPGLARADVALRQIEALKSRLSEAEQEPPACPATPTSRGLVALELDAVTHAYPQAADESTFSLGPVSLRIEAGEVVFLLGGNGSGKTTLALLLCGLLHPTSGHIRLNDRCVEQDDLPAYRENFSAVFSDFHLFERLLGSPAQERDQRARELLARLELEGRLEIRDGVFSTLLLSQGQQKRVALLQALLDDRPCLIFDELAADQDPGFKRFFYTVLLPELKRAGKCVVVISHDDRYFGMADRCLKLESGKLCEPGSPPLDLSRSLVG